MKDYRISRREALLLGGSALLHSLLPFPLIDEVRESDVPRKGLAAAPGEAPQRVLLIHDTAGPLSQVLYPQITRALDYAKIAYDDADIGPDALIADLSPYSAVALAAESIWRLSDEQALKIKEYVVGGGGLAVLVRAWNPALREVFGIQERQEPEGILVESGLRFVADFFPGLQDLYLEEQYLSTFSAMAVTAADSVEVLATSGDGQYPLLWRHKFGRGRVLYWNNDLLAFKVFRGFAVQSLLDVHPAAVMALANVGLFHVDDFPAPPPTRKLEPVAGEYDMSVVDFYYKVWFPDMMRLARKYGLYYLWIIPFNYNGLVEPPWDFNQWVHAKIEVNGQEVPFCSYMSHQVAQGEHELALHGYDHQSLRLDWWMRDGIGEQEARRNMVSALEEARRRWQEDSMGPLPFSYVPPNNLYDAAGLEALHEAFPSIKVVGGIYTDKFEHGGSREFGPEPWNDDLFSIPRWTHGYFDKPFTRLVALSELNMFGVWTHFVHPDDIFNTRSNYPGEDDLRNPYDAPWRGDPSDPADGMFDQLDHLLAWNREHYPWLRWMTTRDSYAEFVNYFETQASYTFAGDEIVVRFSEQPTHLLVRLSEGQKLDLRRVSNAQIISIQAGEGYVQYVLKGMGQEVRLGLDQNLSGLYEVGE